MTADLPIKDMVLALLGGATMSLLFQTQPPFHVLAHELAQLGSILGGVAQVFIARRLRRRWPDDLDRAGMASLCCVVGFGLGVHGTTVLANELVYACDTANTGLYFWLTWFPMGAITTVIGLATASWRPARVVLLLGALVVLTVFHDFARFGLGLRAADPFIGYTIGFDQRADMALNPRHVLQRLWLLGVAGALWSVMRGSRFRALVVAAMTLVTVVWSGDMGMGVGWGPKRILDGVYEGEHVRLHYDRTGEARHRLRAIEREAEWTIHRLTDAWGMPSDGLMVDLDIYDDAETLHDVTGHTSAHAGTRFAAMAWSDALDDTMEHEMVHAIDYLAGRSPMQVFINRGRAEGSAVAWTDGYTDDDEAHEVLAVAAKEGQLPSADQLMSPFGFWSVPESIAYRASGSFVGFLIRRHGVDRWMQWLASRDLTLAYERSVEELDEEWRDYLAGLEPGEVAQSTASWAFDPVLAPPAVARTCPKLGPRAPDPVTAAQEAYGAGNREEAIALYGDLYAEHGTPYLFWRLIDILQYDEQYDEVLRRLDDTDADAVGHSRLLETRVRSLIALGRHGPELRATLDARVQRSPHARFEAALRLFEHPDLGERLPSLLQRGSNVANQEVQRLSAELVRQHPEVAEDLWTLESDLLRWPYIGHAHGPAAVRGTSERMLELLRRDPSICGTHGQLWYDRVLILVQIEACGPASELIDVFQETCETDGGPLERLQDRLRWERMHEEDGACASSMDRHERGG